jgi:RNA polymerase sigma-70 factor (ECF subfamily)
MASVIDPIKSLADDAEAIARAVNGDTDAFSVIYEKYVGRIYNYLYYRTGTQFDAEDLTARVFYKAFDHIGQYQNKGVPFSAWLYRIAHNLVANWYRDNSRRKEVPLDDYGHLHSQNEYPEESMVQRVENEALMKAIRKLPPHRQQMVILKFVEHLSNAEIAVVMGRSEGAIKSFYHRTLQYLKEEMRNNELLRSKDVENRA